MATNARRTYSQEHSPPLSTTLFSKKLIKFSKHATTDSICRLQSRTKYLMRCAIWYNLYNFKKNIKNTHGGVLILVKLQAKPATLRKLTLLHGCFSRFLNCTNGTKSRNASHIWNKEEIQ